MLGRVRQLKSPQRAEPSARVSPPQYHPRQVWRWGRPTSTSATRPTSVGCATQPRSRFAGGGNGARVTLDFQWLTPVSDLIVIYSRDHDPTASVFQCPLDRHRVVIGSSGRPTPWLAVSSWWLRLGWRLRDRSRRARRGRDLLTFTKGSPTRFRYSSVH